MKTRLDQLLVQLGHYDTREKAKRGIMAGLVRHNGIQLTKAGEMVDDAIALTLEQPTEQYVSRGGNKLKKAIEVFHIHLEGKTCMDIGASTGGFTDCMLKNGAAKVYAVDVGYGQLDWKLRQDERVINLERTNIRHLEVSTIPDKMDFISIDVSFIASHLVLPKAMELMTADYEMVLLIKPQFEAGKERMKKSGVISSAEVHCDVLFEAIERIEKLGLRIASLDYSPIKGPKGNIEFICHIQSTGTWSNSPQIIKNIVDKAHNELK